MQESKNELLKNYSEQRFWSKFSYCFKSAGIDVIRKSLWLYYAAQKPDTPPWAKTVIYSTLVYFISPIDAIPDALPGIGYSDDLIVIAAAIASIAIYIDKGVKSTAEETLRAWFK